MCAYGPVNRRGSGATAVIDKIARVRVGTRSLSCSGSTVIGILSENEPFGVVSMMLGLNEPFGAAVGVGIHSRVRNMRHSA